MNALQLSLEITLYSVLAEKNRLQTAIFQKSFSSISGQFSAIFGHFLGVRGVNIWMKHVPGTTLEVRCPSTFMNLIYRNFAWIGDVKSPLCIVGTSWIGFTHGNAIFDCLEQPALKKYSICRVFQAFFSWNPFYHVFSHFINSAVNNISVESCPIDPLPVHLVGELQLVTRLSIGDWGHKSCHSHLRSDRRHICQWLSATNLSF